MRDWSIERLAEHHEIADFDCGAPSLSIWLKQNAGQFSKKDLARVYVIVAKGSARVFGYYCLSNCQARFEDLPAAQSKRLPPRMPVPAVLIGKMAVDSSAQGRGLGGLLLLSALRLIQDVAERVGARAVCVDAVDDEARGFYLHYGFEPLLDDPRHLYLPMQAIRKLDLPPSAE